MTWRILEGDVRRRITDLEAEVERLRISNDVHEKAWRMALAEIVRLRKTTLVRYDYGDNAYMLLPPPKNGSDV